MIMIRNLVRKSFSSLKQKGIPEAFTNPSFYTENQEKCMAKTGIEQFSFEFNNKKITIYGLPTELETQSLQQQYIQDLSELSVNTDQNTNILLQIDPCFHMYEKRKVKAHLQSQVQYQGQKLDTTLIEQNPTIPQNVFELDMEPYLLELAKANKEEVQQLYQIIQTKDLETAKNYQGYYSRFFNNENSDLLESEEGQKMYEELCKQIQLQVLNNPTSSQNDYVTLIVLNILRGHKIFLGDVPSLYLRILLGEVIDLPYLRTIFKQILQFQRENQMFEVEGIHQMLMGQIFQQHVDFYLYYTIQQLTVRDDVDALSCYVSNNHIEPLKIMSKHYGEEGYMRFSPYQEFMQLSKSENQSLDEEKLEKHALLELIFETNLWEKEFVQNKFPYLHENYVEMSENDKMQIQKTFFSHVAKYKALKQQFLKDI